MGKGAVAGVVGFVGAGGGRLFFGEFGAGEASETVVFCFGGVGGVVVEGWVGGLAGAHRGRELIILTSRAQLIHSVGRHGR